MRAQGEADSVKGVVVADGKTLFMWDDLLNSVVKQPQNDRYTLPWRDMMATTDSLVGSYLSDWLFGQHWLRPLKTDEVLTGADTFEAKALPAKIINGAPAQGVALRATKNATRKNPKYTAEQIMWFRADGRLARAQRENHLGAKIRRDTVDVIGERPNLALPASTWALQK